MKNKIVEHLGKKYEVVDFDMELVKKTMLVYNEESEIVEVIGLRKNVEYPVVIDLNINGIEVDTISYDGYLMIGGSTKFSSLLPFGEETEKEHDFDLNNGDVMLVEINGKLNISEFVKYSPNKSCIYLFTNCSYWWHKISEIKILDVIERKE